MKRLIIEHGGRITRHELGDEPVTIGRDPQCDLYFADQRLSRQHCRVQAIPEGLLFEDLGSRNGSFVDSQRVEVVTLSPNEAVRLGGLVLRYEDDSPPVEARDVEDETVMLETNAPDSGLDENNTVMLTARPPEHTPKIMETKAPPDSADKTVMLPKDPGAGAKPEIVKTRMLDAKSLGENVRKVPSDTMLLPRDAEHAQPAPPAPSARPARHSRPSPPGMDEAPGTAAPELGWMASLSWSAKLLFLVSSVALVVYLTLAFPLMRTLGSALREESLRRGRNLLMLAAASNGDAVGEERIRDLSVDAVLREERVKEVFLLDLEGNVLAPSSRADETITVIDGIDANLADIRTFYLGRRGSDYVMVEPLLHRSRRVGVAVLVYEAASASASWATAVLFLSFLVMLLGVVVALVLGKRFTLEPLSSFRDDIEAVVKGDADYVPAQQGFSELSALSKSVNRLIARAYTESSRQAAVAPAPPPEAPRVAAPGSTAGGHMASSASSKRPITAAVRTSPDPDAARFWVDANYIVVRADDEAAAIVGASATEMEGKHLIEAVADQKLLEVVLDAVNALEELPAAETTAELPGGTAIRITATKDMGNTVVGLYRL